MSWGRGMAERGSCPLLLACSRCSCGQMGRGERERARGREGAITIIWECQMYIHTWP